MDAKQLWDELFRISLTAQKREVEDIPVQTLTKDDLKTLHEGYKHLCKPKTEEEREGIDPELVYLLGMISQKLCWHKEAEAFYSTAVRLDPQNADAWYHLGQLLRSRGKHDLADDMLRKSLEVAPRNWPYRNAAIMAIQKTNRGDVEQESPQKNIPRVSQDKKITQLDPKRGISEKKERAAPNRRRTPVVVPNEKATRGPTITKVGTCVVCGK